MTSSDKSDSGGHVISQGSETVTVAAEPTKTETNHERSLLSAITLIITCFSALLLATMANTTASIALPDIGRDLNIEEDRLQWVISAFALSSGCFLLLFGRLADIHGRKKVFLFGMAWSTVFGLGCGFTKTEIQLDVLRGFQGIGSAATIPAALGILAHSFPPSRLRSVAFAVFSAGAPFGGGLGLTMGGIVTQFSRASWRGVFFLTCGASALAFIAGILSIDPDLPSTEPDKRVDWVGAALVTMGLVLVTFVLGQGPVAKDGFRTPYLIALLIIGVFLVGCFVYWEHYLVSRTTRPPLMRLDLWTRANGKFAAMQSIAFFEWCGFMSWVLWSQLYYQNFLNLTPVHAMIRFLPMTVTGLILNLIVGFVVGWLDVIWLLIIGVLATGAGCILFAVIVPSAPYWAFGFPAAILSVGGADFIFACGTLFVARVALPHEQSVAGGVFQTVTQIGTSFGLAITTIAHNQAVNRESRREGTTPDLSGANASPQAALKGFKAAQWTSFGFVMAAGVIAVLFLRNVGIVGHRTAKAEPPPEDMEKKSAHDGSVAELDGEAIHDEKHGEDTAPNHDDTPKNIHQPGAETKA